MTPEQRVIDAAKAWHATGICDDATWGKEEWALAEAVRALTPPLPPEPEDGAVVIARRDTGDEVYQRTDSDEFSAEHRWYMAGEEHPRTWQTVCAGSEVERLLPASSVVDVALAREAAEALFEYAFSHCQCAEGYYRCTAHAVVRALLARLDAAAGGAR